MIAPQLGPSPLPTTERLLRLLRGLALAVVAVFTLFADPGPGWSGRSLAITVSGAVSLAAVVVAITLRVRARSVPIAVFFVLAVSTGILAGAALHSPAVCYPFLLAGYLAAVTEVRWAAALIATIAVTLLVSLLVFNEPGSALFAAGVLVMVTLGGMVRRSSREQTRYLARALAEAERARDAEAETAALAERARIARDLHDVLAHSIAALGLKLDAVDALLDAGQEPRAHAEVRSARRLARDGLVETRRAVAALRDDSVPLPELLRSLAGSDPDPVALEVSGPERELAPAVRQALYRAAQEGVTNARKHAPVGRISIALRYEPEATLLSVTNTRSGRPAAPEANGLGAGLSGMRQRVDELGGAVQAGPTPSGGWSIDVRVPG